MPLTNGGGMEIFMSKRRSNNILNYYKLLIFSFVIAIAVAFSGTLTIYGQDWTAFGGNDDHNCVTDVKLPEKVDETSLKWAAKMPGDGAMGNSCTPPIIVGNRIYSASNDTLLELDSENGKILRKASLAGNTSFATNPIAYAKDRHTGNKPYVFIQLKDGKIQCINIEKMESVWVSTAYKDEQTISPVVYKNGKVYTGTWDNEKGRFLCFDVNGSGTQEPKWSLIPAENGDGNRGFYWAGAYVNDKYAVFGSDADKETGKSVLYSVNAENGQIVDKIKDFQGGIRSTVVHHNRSLYFATNKGDICKVILENDGKFRAGSKVTKALGANKIVTGSPVIHEGRLYIGAVDAENQYNNTGSHKMVIMNADNLEIEKEVKTPGGPKAQALLSKNTGENGKVRVYFTCNTPPGGIFFIEYKKGQSDIQCKTLFTPEKEMQEHCISPLCCDDKGVIYYKNDSNHLMAVERNPARLTGLSVKNKKSGKEGKWVPKFSSEKCRYEIVVDEMKDDKVSISPEAPKGQKIYVGGKHVKSNESIEVSVKGKPIDVVVSMDENNGGTTTSFKKTYTLNILKASGNAFLSDLRISKNNSDAYNLPESSDYLLKYTPKFKQDNMTYHTKMFEEDRRFVNIWPKLQHKGSKMKVKPVENVANSQDQLDEEGNIKPETGSTNPRYPVYFLKGTKVSTVKIIVTSETGKVTKTYTVTIIRSKDIGRKILKLSKTKLSLYKGQTYRLKLDVKGKEPGDVIKWKSTNKKVAKVDKNGNMTALKPGKTSIYVTCNDDEEVHCAVAVKSKEFKISKSKISLKAGKKYKVYITKRNPKGKVYYKFANSKSKKYITLYKDGTVKAKRVGTGQIICTCNGINRKLTVKVHR